MTFILFSASFASSLAMRNDPELLGIGSDSDAAAVVVFAGSAEASPVTLVGFLCPSGPRALFLVSEFSTGIAGMSSSRSSQESAGVAALGT